MEWYLKVLEEYVNFNGRARRKEYWMFSLFNLIFALLSLIIGYMGGIGEILYSIYLLGTSLPSWAVTVRRLHDVGKSGWMVLISLIPVIGPIWLIVLLVSDSVSDENQYGCNPKAIEN